MLRDHVRPTLNVYDEVYVPELFAGEPALVYRATAMETRFEVGGVHRQYVSYHLVSKENPCIYFNVAEIWDHTFRCSLNGDHLDEESLYEEPLQLTAAVALDGVDAQTPV